MLKNHCLAQAVSDSNFGAIRRQLEYKAAWQGTHLVVIDRFCPSSKTCSSCGWIDAEQTLADRIFVCQDCGSALDRDLNAAKNILTEALRSTASSAGTYACGVSSSGVSNGIRETAHLETGTKGDVWAVSQMSMF
jgi:putative transposase